jgi:hypothetical protein
MCQLRIDECRTGGNIQCERCWYPEQTFYWNVPVTRQFCYRRRLCPSEGLLEGIVALADESVPYVCPSAFVRVNTTLIFESGVLQSHFEQITILTKFSKKYAASVFRVENSI